MRHGLSCDEVEHVFRRLTQQLVFNEIELDSHFETFVVFETMNNRGKPPSKLELLKNRLIYLSTLVLGGDAQRETLRRSINAAWKTIYQFLGKESDHPLPDDEFLRAHWIMYFREAGEKPEEYAESLLKEHFSSDRVASNEQTADNIQRFVDSIQSSVKKWHALHFPDRVRDLEPDVQQALERCGRLGRGAFAPAIMAALQKEEPQKDLVAFLEAAERFVFLVRRLCQRRSDLGDKAFYRLAGELHRGTKSLIEATAFVKQIANERFALHLAQSEMQDLFTRYEGFYSWSGRYYFLFEYEQALKDSFGMQGSKINWEDFTKWIKDQETVEHIYPRSPRPGQWPAFEAGTEQERHRLRHTLGNLLLLSQSRNSELSNRRFAEKKHAADGVTGYDTGSYSEIDVSKKQDWTPKEVLERGVKMLEFLEDRWNVKLGSRADKVKLLGLEFLEPNPTPVQIT